jgi:hypothetical protein
MSALARSYAGDPLIPADALSIWLRARPESNREIQLRTQLNERRIGGFRRGEYHRVTVGLADRIVTALGGHINDVWPDLDEVIDQALSAPHQNTNREAMAA